jgi:membrane protein implicated in regulation of membrane protease activity
MPFNPSFFQNSIKLLHQPVLAEVAEVTEAFLRVKYGNTTWKARLYDCDRPYLTLTPGQQIKIIAVEGTLTVLIEA